jgi:AmmeMemoRadiSam system protein A
LDQEGIKALRTSALVQSHTWAHTQEHAIEIELPLLQRALAPGWSLVPVLVGALDGDDYDEAAALLRPIVDADTLVVVSSDFTHYGERFGYQPFPLDDAVGERLRELDDGALDRIMAGDRDGLLDYHQRTGITVCGLRPIAVLLGMLPADARLERIAYTTSGALTEDFENSVSYAVVAVGSPRPLAEKTSPNGVPSIAPDEADQEALTPEAPAESGNDDLTEADLRLLHRLAVLALEQTVLGRDPDREAVARSLLAELPPRLKRDAGVFVTLKRDGALRGCIGDIEPRKPLYQAVLENGVNAAVNDYRFSPVSAPELEALEVEISVLTPPRPIPSADFFVVGQQGIVLNKAGRRAVFLPEVAVEHGWDLVETLTQLARKAGLPDDAWRDGADLEVFESLKLTGPYAAGSAGPATVLK